MNIIDSLFGKKKTFNHPIIGILKSQRIKGNNHAKSYTWYGNIFLNNKSLETTIILEGSNSSPFPNHLNFISQLMNNWESEYLPKIENKINEIGINKIGKYSNWKNDFYLSAIYPMNDKNSEFELTLEPLDKQKTDSIGIEIKNNIITKIEKYE
ncbi:MAG: hypothetical protein CMC05_09090 [Flavobacteriaceae bacterium]|nr:hypothetical protein [Flavobacteriaceae bacterium]MBD10975.1 hypothetical protein [Flavobacteriaceae bacterium]|tara:strand:+ start:729 stop:1190 length:462 start_codon:yes stop_codon:yes gene_type:complete